MSTGKLTKNTGRDYSKIFSQNNVACGSNNSSTGIYSFAISVQYNSPLIRYCGQKINSFTCHLSTPNQTEQTKRLDNYIDELHRHFAKNVSSQQHF